MKKLKIEKLPAYNREEKRISNYAKNFLQQRNFFFLVLEKLLNARARAPFVIVIAGNFRYNYNYNKNNTEKGDQEHPL